MTTVRAAVLTRTGDQGPFASTRPIEIRELSLEAPGPDEIRVQIRAAGICHSDLSVVNGSRPRPVPMVLGHEAAGEVIEVGAQPSEFQVGDRVVLAFVPSCGKCSPCAAGRSALCEPGATANAAGTLLSGERRWTDSDGSHPHHHLGVSAFAEQVVVSERSAVKIPDQLPFDVAAVFGCAALTGVGAALNAAQIQPGDSVAIFGLGGVGLAALLGAKLAGAGQIIAIDPVGSKRELAVSLGAHTTLAGTGDTVAELKGLTAGGPARVIETAGSAKVLETAYLATGRGGTTVTVGLPDPAAILNIPAVSLVAEERTLKGSYLGSSNPRKMLPQLFEHWAEGNLPIERLISHRLTLDEINEGFDRLATGEAVRQIIAP
ncbi:MAG: alcohol dehydrogenase catalytic domain-containing protein [Solirubrobacterales bacterium]|nr:alcohol dehydrogenase catalytic domain-containing protein [Solirubrobacterales bacterium]